MERKAAYENLAKWFEYLNDDCGYENWSQYLILQLQRYPLQTGMDIGCGGGWFTRAFQRAGYQMTGMDVSAQMLNFAQEKALCEGVRSEYILGDITNMKLPRRFDFATAINDCVNYIPKSALRKAFKNVHASLKKGGVFLFDVSSEKKFRNQIADTISADDREDVTYLAFQRVKEDIATLDVTLFVRREDGAFERLDETHTQYIYKEEEIKQALQESGFCVIKVEGHLGEDKAQSDRIMFLAQKKENK